MSKQIIVLRKDLKMNKGKLVAQGCHASLAVVLNMMNQGKSIREQTPEIINGQYSLQLNVQVGSAMDDWLRGIFRKVTLTVNSEEELLDIYQKAVDKGLPVALIEDLGLTAFHGIKTKTCLAIGPSNAEEIDSITQHLKLF